MSSHQVSFTTHGSDLRSAYDAILRPTDPKTGDNWALFGYDKGTNDLKVLGRGSGGLEELEEEFMDGKIQYAFTRIIDPNTQLNKFVLIGWCGDGVPESKKGLFSSHLADVSNFLKGYHLQINARNEADVTPAQIMKRVNEGSGSKYSIHNETQTAERIRPLQSAYKKTEIPDIAALQRNPTKPEPAPKYNIGTKPFGASSSSSAPAAAAKPFGASSSFSAPAVAAKPVDRSWNAPVASAASTASSLTSTPVERSWKSSVGSSYTAATGSGFNKIAPPASLLNYGQSTPNEPVVNKAQQMRLEREAREKEERERIKREIAASEARERSNDNQNSAQKQAEERRIQEQRECEREQQQQEQQRSQDHAREERAAREKEERERAEAEDAARSAREAIQARETAQSHDQAAQEAEKKRQQEQQQRERERADREAAQRQEREQREQEEQERQRLQEQEEEERRLQEEEERRQLEEEEERRLQEEVAAATAQSVDLGADALLASSSHAQAAPGSVSAIVLYSYEKAEENEMSLIEGEIIFNVTELDVGWWSGESEDGQRSGLFPANYVEVIEHSHEHAASAHHEEEPVHAHEAIAEEPYHQEPAGHVAVDAASSGKPTAAALYDYNAGEPNEISFSEGDTLTDIEFVTEDWWSGRTHDGSVGLFPSNYVELHQ